MAAGVSYPPPPLLTALNLINEFATPIQRTQLYDDDNKIIQSALTVIEGALLKMAELTAAEWQLILNLRKKTQHLDYSEKSNNHVLLRKCCETFRSTLIKHEKKRRQQEFEEQQLSLLIEQFEDCGKPVEKIAPHEEDPAPPQAAQSQQELMEQLLKRIEVSPESIPQQHKDALAVRHAQIQFIGGRFLKDFGPMLIECSVSIINEILAHPESMEEINASIIAGSFNLPLEPEALLEFNRIAAIHLPTMLTTQLTMTRELLNSPICGPALLKLIMDYITPYCFKKPSSNLSLQKILTLSSFQAIYQFIADLNKCFSNGINFSREDSLLLEMHALYQARSGKTLIDTKNLDVVRTRQLLRTQLKDLCAFLLSQELDKLNTASKIGIALLPHIMENLISKLVDPYTLYTLSLRFFETFYVPGAAAGKEDPIQDLCRSKVFLSTGEVDAPSDQFPKELGKLFLLTAVEALKLTEFGITSKIISLISSLIEPSMVSCAKQVEDSLFQLGSSACLYMPFETINSIFYERTQGQMTPAENVKSLFEQTADEKIEGMAKLKAELAEKINLKVILENEIDRSSDNRFSAAAKKLLCPSDHINNVLPPILGSLANNPSLMYLMIGYILSSIEEELRKANTG